MRESCGRFHSVLAAPPDRLNETAEYEAVQRAEQIPVEEARQAAGREERGLREHPGLDAPLHPAIAGGEKLGMQAHHAARLEELHAVVIDAVTLFSPSLRLCVELSFASEGFPTRMRSSLSTEPRRPQSQLA